MFPGVLNSLILTAKLSRFGLTNKSSYDETRLSEFSLFWTPSIRAFQCPANPNAVFAENTPVETCCASIVIDPIPLSTGVNFSCADFISIGFLLESKNEILNSLLPV